MLVRIGWIAVAFLLAQCGKDSQTSLAPPIPLMGAPSTSNPAATVGTAARSSRAVTLKGASGVGTNATNVVAQGKKFFEIIDIADNVNCILSAARQTGVFPTLFDGNPHTISYNGTLVDKFIAKAIVTADANVVSSVKVWVCDTKQATRTQTVYSSATNTNGTVSILAKVHETNGFINRVTIDGTMLTTGLWVGNKTLSFNRDAGAGEQFTIQGNQSLSLFSVNSIKLPSDVLGSVMGLTGNIYRTASEASGKNALTPPPSPLFAGYAIGPGSVRSGNAGAFGATLHFDGSLADTGTASDFAAATNALTALTATTHNAGIAAAAYDAAKGETVDCNSLVAEKTFEEMTANLDSKAPSGSTLRGVDISGNVFTEAALNVCL